MTLHDRLERMKAKNGLTLNGKVGAFNLRSSTDNVPDPHGSFIPRATRNSSRSSAKHMDILRKLKWLAAPADNPIEPLTFPERTSLLPLSPNDVSCTALPQPSAISDSKPSQQEYVQHPVVGSKRLRSRDEASGSPAAKKRATEVSSSPNLRRSSRSVSTTPKSSPVTSPARSATASQSKTSDSGRGTPRSGRRSSASSGSDKFLAKAVGYEKQFEELKEVATATKRQTDKRGANAAEKAMWYLKAGLKYLESIAALEDAVMEYRKLCSKDCSKEARAKKNEFSVRILGMYSTTAKFLGDCAGLMPLDKELPSGVAASLKKTAAFCYFCLSVCLSRRFLSLRHRLGSSRVDWLKSVKSSSSKQFTKKEKIKFLEDIGDTFKGMDALDLARSLMKPADLPDPARFVHSSSISKLVDYVGKKSGAS